MARGGGYYACGFVVTFLWLEIKTFASEVASMTGVGSFLSEQLLEFFVRFTVQSIENTVGAFLWPVRVIERWPLGWAVLIAGYVIFRYFIKAKLQRWMFDEEPLDDGTDRRSAHADERPLSD